MAQCHSEAHRLAASDSLTGGLTIINLEEEAWEGRHRSQRLPSTIVLFQAGFQRVAPGIFHDFFLPGTQFGR